MDDEVYCCLGCVVVIFLIFAGFSIYGTISDFMSASEANYDDVYIDNVTCYFSNHSDGWYGYYVHFDLHNFSCPDNADVVTTFYENDKIVSSDCRYDFKEYYFDEDNNYVPDLDKGMYLFSNDEANSTTSLDYLETENGTTKNIIAELETRNFSNITHVQILIIDCHTGEVIFNTTEPFDMRSNYEEVDDGSNRDNFNSTDDVNDTDSTKSDNRITYVASVNSDKFHEPSCSQAKRINEGNKITFSSRQEAIDAGYSPCGICYP